MYERFLLLGMKRWIFTKESQDLTNILCNLSTYVTWHLINNSLMNRICMTPLSYYEPGWLSRYTDWLRAGRPGVGVRGPVLSRIFFPYVVHLCTCVSQISSVQVTYLERYTEQENVSPWCGTSVIRSCTALIKRIKRIVCCESKIHLVHRICTVCNAVFNATSQNISRITI